MIRKPAVALACLCVALVPCSSAAAKLVVGINDDVKYEASTPTFFLPTMEADGLRVDTLTIRWDDTQPTTIPGDLQAALTTVIGQAATDGVKIQLDLYPLHSQVFTGGYKCPASTDPTACGDTDGIQAFAAWTAMVAQTFPSVHDFAVMNECNQPLFVNPQWTTGGQNQSAEICGRALAAAYDALKAEDPANFVWGVGLSPRGNDRPNAPSNSSTSPVKFLEDLGTWFKAFAAKTHRKTPLMDGLDFHPYPVPQSLPFATGYPNPNDASIANLSRIYQAFYDGFNGSPQRTIGQQKGGGLPISLDEMGIQTDASSQPGYEGVEVSANAAGGMVGADATQAYQATYYGEMLAYLACDRNVKVVDLFHLVDEANLAGWQSGLFWVGTAAPAPKQSAKVVSTWIHRTGGRCQGASKSWLPAGSPSLEAGSKQG
jgi:hypothetical protein